MKGVFSLKIAGFSEMNFPEVSKYQLNQDTASNRFLEQISRVSSPQNYHFDQKMQKEEISVNRKCGEFGAIRDEILQERKDLTGN